MTIVLTNPPTGDGLFDILGKAFHALNTLNTARLTTVPPEVLEFIDQAQTLEADLNLTKATDSVTSSITSWQASGGPLASKIRGACQVILIGMVQNDSPAPAATLLASLSYLIDQMETDGTYVDANAVSLTVTADSDNLGDAAILTTTRRGDGRPLENLLGETIAATVISDSSPTNPTLRFTGESAESGMSHLWPAGSGTSKSVTATDPAASLLSNGDFEATTIANVPDDWIVYVGTPGVEVRVTNPEIQTVTISGTPTAGSYVLIYTDPTGIQRPTVPLAYNATASQVEDSLRAVPGLGGVDVAATGTSPDVTHGITFTGVAGDLTEMTSLNFTIGGTLTHATTTPGEDGAYKGRALRLDCTRQLAELYHPLTLNDQQVYFCHLRISRRTDGPEESSSSSNSSSSSSNSSSSSSTSSSSNSSSSTTSTSSSATSTSSYSRSSSSFSLSSTSSTSSSSTSSQGSSSYSSLSSTSSSRGSSTSSTSESTSSSTSSSSSQDVEELRLEIVDGVGGNVTTDDEGYENALRISTADLDTTHASQFFSFRLRRSAIQPVYLRIRTASLIPPGDSIYLDEIAVVAATELYAGGPLVAAISGATAAVNQDTWSLVATNDRAGEFQEWFNRAFSMASSRLLLPSAGITNIADSLIA